MKNKPTNTLEYLEWLNEFIWLITELHKVSQDSEESITSSRVFMELLFELEFLLDRAPSHRWSYASHPAIRVIHAVGTWSLTTKKSSYKFVSQILALVRNHPNMKPPSWNS